MRCFSTSALVAGVLAATPVIAEPLSSWNDGAAKSRILEFVSAVSTEGSETFVPVADRVAVFDNDGTLWAEQPVYFQLFFAMDRLKALAAENPDILTSDVLKAAAEGDLAKVAEAGTDGILEVINASHGNVSVAQFTAEVRDWITTAKHPTKDVLYTDLTYQPMLELLDHLRDNQFDVYIVSGGGIHFMRAFAEEAYGIPPQNVIGTQTTSEYRVVDGVPMIFKTPGIAFIDDKEGKPVGIDTHIGKRPILAGGNSDGDFQMLEWTTSGDGPHFGLLVHHTDAERAWAYDRDSHIGRLDAGLDEGPDRGWLIVDMKEDWAQVFRAEQ